MDLKLPYENAGLELEERVRKEYREGLKLIATSDDLGECSDAVESINSSLRESIPPLDFIKKHFYLEDFYKVSQNLLYIQEMIVLPELEKYKELERKLDNVGIDIKNLPELARRSDI